MTPVVAFTMGIPTQWLIIGAVALVLFGGSKISQFGKGLRDGMR